MYNDTSENEARVRRNWNVLIFLAATVILFTVILFRLFSLQYIHYEENFQRSENNRLRRIELIADRGYIYDRNGQVLVRNRPSYQIALQALEMPRKKAGRDSVFQRLLNICDASGARPGETSARGGNAYTGVKIRKNRKKTCFPLEKNASHAILNTYFFSERASLSSRGLGHQVFILVTRVRIPLGMPFLYSDALSWRMP